MKNPTEQTALQKALIAARKKKKLTHAEISTRAGIAKSYLCELESGKMRNPSLNVLAALARELKFSRATIVEIIGESA